MPASTHPLTSDEYLDKSPVLSESTGVIGKACLLAFLLLVHALAPKASASPWNSIPPTITQLSPNQGYSFEPTTVTVTGTNFSAGLSIQMNDVLLENISLIDTTSMTATVPAHLPSGVYDVTITNTDALTATLSAGFTVLAPGDGSLGPWQAINSLVTPRNALASVAAKGRIYAIGGGNASGDSNAVESARINPDGSLGAWRTESSMTLTRTFPAAAVVGDYIYVFAGGTSSGWGWEVERALVHEDGTLGAWEAAPHLNQARSQGPAAVVANGFVYVLGGRYFKSVERAAINPDGSLGTWQTLNNMTTERDFFGAVVAAGYLYTTGGEIGSSYLDSVERAAINADGTLGEWEFVNSLTSARCFHGMVSEDDYFYLYGGQCGAVDKSVERARVYPDGSLGSWQVVSMMNSVHSGHGAVLVRDHIYAIGGNTNAGMGFSVERAPIHPPALTGFSPSSVLASQATTVTVNGSNLPPQAMIQLGATSPLPTTFLSPNILSLTLPAGLASGWYTATLNEANGRTAVLSSAVRIDGTPPVPGSLVINGGAPATNSPHVTLTTAASDPDDSVVEMGFSNDGLSWEPWLPYATSADWSLTAWDGIKPVYGRFRDSVGNVSSVISDVILLDTVAPTGSVRVMDSRSGVPGTPRTVTLLLSATDDASGVASMLISNKPDFVGANWETYVTSRLWTLDSNNIVYVRFRDDAGNVSLTYFAWGWTTYFPLISK